MINWYKRCLETHPYFSRMMTAGTILTSFDVMNQTFIEKREKYDFKKIGINFSVGFAAAPWLFIWFTKLQPKIIQATIGKPATPTLIDPVTRKINFKQLFVKITTDYVVCFPMMQILYHSGFNLLYNQNVQSIKNAFQTKVDYSLKHHYQVWPLLCTLNHLFIPPYLRAPFANLSATSWNNYVNYIFPKIQNKQKTKKDQSKVNITVFQALSF
ncbi:hypothetical protein ABPG74_021390 [Tetrahymena malaccensis]